MNKLDKIFSKFGKDKAHYLIEMFGTPCIIKVIDDVYDAFNDITEKVENDYTSTCSPVLKLTRQQDTIEYVDRVDGRIFLSTNIYSEDSQPDFDKDLLIDSIIIIGDEKYIVVTSSPIYSGKYVSAFELLVRAN